MKLNSYSTGDNYHWKNSFINVMEPNGKTIVYRVIRRGLAHRDTSWDSMKVLKFGFLCKIHRDEKDYKYFKWITFFATFRKKYLPYRNVSEQSKNSVKTMVRRYSQVVFTLTNFREQYNDVCESHQCVS